VSLWTFLPSFHWKQCSCIYDTGWKFSEISARDNIFDFLHLSMKRKGCVSSIEETQSIILTHKYMTCLSTDTSIKSGGVKLVLWAQTSPLSEMMLSCKCFPRMSRISTNCWTEWSLNQAEYFIRKYPQGLELRQESYPTLKVPGFLLIKQKFFRFFRLIVLLLTIG
jgi:hypothetical protein